jgi:LruC domain-containing protein
MIYLFRKKLVNSILLMLTVSVTDLYAQSFAECPTEAFLVQDKLANLYGVKLATGFYEKVSPIDWNQQKMNALAFNVHDSYLYAFSYYYSTIVRVGSNYEVEPIPLSNVPDKGFYVGDISVQENTYYLYRPGAAYGLFRVSLDETSSDYLQIINVVDGVTLNHAIYDLAFHPDNGFAYSVDRWGNLWQIDVQGGTSVKLSNVGESGTFGAVYFDVAGNLYISRNNDGNIFRINTNWDYPVAEFFAFGPASSNNDGARCALAPIVSQDAPTTDFGDAPDSYGSSINNNGARHDVGDGTLFLGQNVTSEPNAYADNGAEIDDNDGIQFVTGVEAGKTSLVEITSSADGFINAWIDSDQSGEFDANEQIISSEPVTSGSNIVIYELPVDSEIGTTWARFRLSTEPLISPIGGVSDGEVEDYKIDIAEQDLTATHYYPSVDDWATLAFEDNWPLIGDYDMNDLVVRYRLSHYDAAGKLTRINIEGEVVAIGASYRNGFAFRIPGLLRSQVKTNRSKFKINGVEQNELPLEQGRDEAILIIADDLWDFVTSGEDCKYYRTEPGCGSNIQMTFSLEIHLEANVNTTDVAGFPYDPFIFSSPEQERNYIFGEAPDRRFEIHLKNQAPTEAFQMDFLGRGDDNSNPNQGEYFINANGMPWAINIPYEWQYPLEYMDIKYAYPDFHSFVTSSGKLKTDWFTREKSNIKNVFTH